MPSAGLRKPGQAPRIRGGAHSATADLDRIERWWRHWPDANVAIATGALVVLDVDGPLGETQLRRLEHRNQPLRPTASVRTGRGRHLYFLAAGHSIRSIALGSHLHVRGHGGYAVAPPSRHATGATYQWARTGELAAVPGWLVLLTQPPWPRAPISWTPPLTIGRKRAYLRVALERELADVRATPPGRRNITLNRAAFRLGQLADAGLTNLEDLSAQLLAAALPEHEARATIASGLDAGARQPRRIPNRT